jgi:hypothetical protein
VAITELSIWETKDAGEKIIFINVGIKLVSALADAATHQQNGKRCRNAMNKCRRM